ncbi:hypothetical protein [Rhizobium sp. S96]|uniref:hypothetical protein n=1 Tax=Rhizobium sp. S96 TaxID=3055140 RepID=UPI0025AAB830|nr:hypothetical protein [Rhizobium sp. S96]MDM9619104.1 hypothetical protein [Rhizobium sp. S96]
MTVIHLPPRLTVVPSRPEPELTIAHAQGLLRSAIAHLRHAEEHALDAAFGNGSLEQGIDLAVMAAEGALLDLLLLSGCSTTDRPLRQILRERQAERENG